MTLWIYFINVGINLKVLSDDNSFADFKDSTLDLPPALKVANTSRIASIIRIFHIEFSQNLVHTSKGGFFSFLQKVTVLSWTSGGGKTTPWIYAH